MKIVILSLLFAFTSAAFAQHSDSSLWLDADGTYSLFDYSDSAHAQKAQLAGVRGELGFALPFFGVTLGATYMDGYTEMTGNSLTGVATNVTTHDYMSDFRALANFMYSGLDLAGGLATSEWYDNNGSYRERRKFVYIPVTLTISNKFVYLKLEGDKISKGAVTATTSQLGGGATDVAMTQNSGIGYGAELGVTLPSAIRIDSRVFVSYHHWSLDPSTVASDGVNTNIQIGKTSLTVVTVGVGLGF